MASLQGPRLHWLQHSRWLGSLIAIAAMRAWQLADGGGVVATACSRLGQGAVFQPARRGQREGHACGTLTPPAVCCCSCRPGRASFICAPAIHAM